MNYDRTTVGGGEGGVSAYDGASVREAVAEAAGYRAQLEALGKAIMALPGDPSHGGGAVDEAVEIMGRAEVRLGSWARRRGRYYRWMAHVQREKFTQAIAWRLPREVAKWAYIRVAMSGLDELARDREIPDQRITEPLDRWERGSAKRETGVEQ